MRLMFRNCFILIDLQLNTFSVKTISLESCAVFETVLTIITAMLELGYWKTLWLVSYSRLNIFVCLKITSFEEIF